MFGGVGLERSWNKRGEVEEGGTGLERRGNKREGGWSRTGKKWE